MKKHIQKYQVHQKSNIKLEENYRPNFKHQIPKIYESLIKRYWSSESNKRPTFEEIANELKTNPDYITDTINKKKFFFFF